MRGDPSDPNAGGRWLGGARLEVEVDLETRPARSCARLHAGADALPWGRAGFGAERNHLTPRGDDGRIVGEREEERRNLRGRGRRPFDDDDVEPPRRSHGCGGPAFLARSRDRRRLWRRSDEDLPPAVIGVDDHGRSPEGSRCRAARRHRPRSRRARGRTEVDRGVPRRELLRLRLTCGSDWCVHCPPALCHALAPWSRSHGHRPQAP